MLDALIELCDRAATAELLPESHGVTPRVSVTISLEDLQRQSGLFGSTETGEDLTATIIRRLCCDADVIPIVLGSRSEVLDVGRQQRLVTTAIWKALVARDHHCRFPNCTRPPVMTHALHIVHWAEGGPTSLENLILLCGHHHRLIHAGPWQIRPTGPASFVFDPPPGARRHVSRPPPDGCPGRAGPLTSPHLTSPHLTPVFSSGRSYLAGEPMSRAASTKARSRSRVSGRAAAATRGPRAS